MATWLVFGLKELGRIEQPTRAHAEREAERLYPGHERVQSLASYQVGRELATRRSRGRGHGHGAVGRGE
jgi:hypothetical protein